MKTLVNNYLIQVKKCVFIYGPFSESSKFITKSSKKLTRKIQKVQYWEPPSFRSVASAHVVSVFRVKLKFTETKNNFKNTYRFIRGISILQIDTFSSLNNHLRFPSTPRLCSNASKPIVGDPGAVSRAAPGSPRMLTTTPWPRDSNDQIATLSATHRHGI